MKFHTREKPYSCDSCDFKCATASVLKYHRERSKKKCGANQVSSQVSLEGVPIKQELDSDNIINDIVN